MSISKSLTLRVSGWLEISALWWFQFRRLFKFLFCWVTEEELQQWVARKISSQQFSFEWPRLPRQPRLPRLPHFQRRRKNESKLLRKKSLLIEIKKGFFSRLLTVNGFGWRTLAEKRKLLNSWDLSLIVENLFRRKSIDSFLNDFGLQKHSQLQLINIICHQIILF